jgi:hypothetical protein
VVKIGKSLSGCVAAIAAGKVAIEDVQMINTGTMAHDDHDWERLKNSYWPNVNRPERAIADELRASGRIYQPRCHGQQPPSTRDGIWE